MKKLAPNATPKEIGAFLASIQKDAGINADSSGHVNDRGEVSMMLWPHGITKNGHVSGTGPDWQKASADLLAKWEAQRANHRSVLLRKMALGIIQITADQGECTDASLRLNFDQSEIDELGAEAAEMANDMASNGPFSIKRTASANAA